MAEGEKPNSSIDLMTQIIPLARALSADLLRFASSNPGGRSLILDLASGAGSSASVLEVFAESMARYGSCDEKIERGIIPRACRGLKTRMECLRTALDETLRNEEDEARAMGDGAVRNERSRHRVLDWRQEALGAELGGVHRMNRLVRAVRQTNENLAFLMNALKYVALQKKEERGEIEDSEKRERDKIMETFPAFHLGGWKSSIQEMGQQADETEVDVNEDAPLPFNRRRSINDDARSIISWDSFASDQFVESKEVYEYWIFQKVHGENRTTKGWSFLGLSGREFVDNTMHSLEGKARPQEEMKARDDETRTEAQYHAREASIHRSIAALPRRFQAELHYLLEDRERQSCNFRFVREWSVIEIQPVQPRIQTPAKTWSGWWKGEGGIQQWGCILKGDTKEKRGLRPSRKERSDTKIPDRWHDAFRVNPYRRAAVDRPVQQRMDGYEEEPVDRVAIMPRPYMPRYRSPVRRPENPPAPSSEEYGKQIKELLNDVTDPEIRLPLKDEGW
ncbi:hypothetical protein BJ875DRAFT_439307 [Amylocarpus encephaloides]|uniref:Fungal N-terminal domain-containing protein n=1 Tax=Amylocarpus encephaloides TaxID=45428 RepID=A0A9P7YMR6_9HELO|nr:hypothetical protein BJ875DRAFT_439307 [Amylocarpus encephaloides]